MLWNTILFVHALLNKTVRVQFFSDSDTKLQMFPYEVLKPACPNLLPLLIKLDLIVVPDNLFNGFPVKHYDFGHGISFSSQFNLLILQWLELLDLPFLQLLLAHPYLFLRIMLLLLTLTFEILLHPNHLFDQELMVRLACRPFAFFLSINLDTSLFSQIIKLLWDLLLSLQ